MATRVLLVDPWWNVAVEEQAFCRTYRRGQEHPTRMTRLVVAGSVDDHMIKLQDRKISEIDAVMSDESRQRLLPIAQLLALFGPVGKDKEGNSFIYSDADADGSRRRNDGPVWRPPPEPETPSVNVPETPSSTIPPSTGTGFSKPTPAPKSKANAKTARPKATPRKRRAADSSVGTPATPAGPAPAQSVPSTVPAHTPSTPAAPAPGPSKTSSGGGKMRVPRKRKRGGADVNANEQAGTGEDATASQTQSQANAGAETTGQADAEMQDENHEDHGEARQ